jgi:hypothetical protein
MEQSKKLVESLFDAIYGKEEILTFTPNLDNNNLLNLDEGNIEQNEIRDSNSNILPSELRDEEEVPVEVNIPKQDRFWNGSVEQIKQMITQITDEEVKYDFSCKLDILIHKARRNYQDQVIAPVPEQQQQQQQDNSKIEKLPSVVSPINNRIRDLLIKLALDIPDICNSVREELILPPIVFDHLTRQSLTEQELAKYTKEQNNKKEEFLRKNKKTAQGKNKPVVDEEEKEQQEFKTRFFDKTKEAFLNSFNNFEEGNLKYTLEGKVLNSILFNDEYVERLGRIKTYNMIKDHLESKIIILRIDINDYIKIETPEIEVGDNIEQPQEGVEVKKVLTEVAFPNAEKTFLESINTLLGFNPKAIILLVNFIDDPDLDIRFLEKFLQTSKLVEAPTVLVTDLNILDNLELNFEDMMYQENSIFLVPNINSFPEEKGYQINEEGGSENLCQYNKFKFMKLLSAGSVFVNDSPFGILKKTPSVLDMICKHRAIGKRLDSQFSKFLYFYLINSPNFMLIIGDMDIKAESPDQYYLQHLLIINALLSKFKVICLMGKIGLVFVQYLQKEFFVYKELNINPIFYQFIKYILVRAKLNGVEIILPTDIRILPKAECEKLREGEVNDVDITETEYYKFIKDLYRREKRQKRIERNHSEEELEEHNYYENIKLKEDEAETLKLYRDNTIEFNANDLVTPFTDAQEIYKPKKILKTELEVRANLEAIYSKPIIFPETPVVITGLNNNLSMSRMSAKTVTNLNNSELHNSNINNTNNNITVNNIPKEPYLFNTETSELVDYGDKTYLNICQAVNRSNCLLWLGKLSPSKIDNIFDSFTTLVENIHERKDILRIKFNELMEEEEKKLTEGDYKAKKFLFNILLKCQSSYKLLKKAFKKFLEDRVQIVFIF